MSTRRKVPETTIVDIAAAAGVSVTTVSRIINAKPDVAEDTRERVTRLMEETGFVPQSAWRQIRSGRSGLIALHVPADFNPPSYRVIMAAALGVEDAGYSINIITRSLSDSRAAPTLPEPHDRRDHPARGSRRRSPCRPLARTRIPVRDDRSPRRQRRDEPGATLTSTTASGSQSTISSTSASANRLPDDQSGRPGQGVRLCHLVAPGVRACLRTERAAGPVTNWRACHRRDDHRCSGIADRAPRDHRGDRSAGAVCGRHHQGRKGAWPPHTRGSVGHRDAEQVVGRTCHAGAHDARFSGR